MSGCMKLNIVSRLFIITNLSWLLISCNDFSASEDRILEETRKAIHSMVTLRDQQNERIIPLIDIEIKKDGNRDTAVFIHLEKVLRRTDEIREFYIKKDSLISKEYLLDNKYYKSKIPSIESPKKFMPFKDSTIINSWASMVKDILVNDHAALVGSSSCGGYGLFSVVVKPFKNVVIQGNPYKASFYLGNISYPIFYGNNVSINKDERYAEVIFQPSLTDKHGIWKGYLNNRGDSSLIEIPYTIIDCK